MSKIALLFLAFGLVFVGCDQKERAQQTSTALAKPNWAAVENLKPTSNRFRVRVWGQSKLKIGDEMSFKVSSSQPGRLWVIQVDANDEVTFLYPNADGQDNRLLADKPVQIPPASADWVLEAGEPKGKSLVAAVVTNEKFELYKGTATHDLNQLSGILGDAEDWGVGRLEVTVE